MTLGDLERFLAKYPHKQEMLSVRGWMHRGDFIIGIYQNNWPIIMAQNASLDLALQEAMEVADKQFGVENEREQRTKEVQTG